MLLKRALLTIAVLLVGLGGVFLMGPRVEVNTDIEPEAVPQDVQGWVDGGEAAIPDLRPGAEKQIVWFNPSLKEKTNLSVVYLHGFSATRQEIAPVCDRLATQLGANLYYARLTGHGRDGADMAEGSVKAWLEDAEEAYQVGRLLGERVVVVGTSTGATLATWLASEHSDLAAMVFVSPNFGLADPASVLLTGPWGLQLATLILGEERSWEPANPGQEMYWSTRYPTRALLPMMGLVDLVDDIDLSQIKIPTLIFYSTEDGVVDPKRIEARFETLGSGRKALVPVDTTGLPSAHVLTGDIMAPAKTDQVVSRSVAFIRGSR